MHPWRSTLILGAFLVFLLLVGTYYVEGYLKNKQKTLKVREDKLQSELVVKQDLVDKAVNMQETLGTIRNLWMYRSKVIPRSEKAYQTYEYFDRILTRRETSLNFDFVQGDIKDSAGVHSATYRVLGEAKFEDLYSFIWYLENLPPLLRINSVKIEHATQKKKEGASSRWVSFELSITAISADRPGLEEMEYSIDVSAPILGYDPFHRPAKEVVQLPANTRQLPNVFETKLQAMTPTQAYVIDQTGELKVLSLGDEVYLGYLSEILPDQNKVVFYLSQLNPPRKVTLSIGNK